MAVSAQNVTTFGTINTQIKIFLTFFTSKASTSTNPQASTSQSASISTSENKDSSNFASNELSQRE